MIAIPSFVVVISPKAEGHGNIEELGKDVVSVDNCAKSFLGDQ